MKKKYIILLTLLLILLVGSIWVIWANTALEMNTITVVNSDLPESFSGFRIAHVSDLHSAQMGKNNKDLLSMLRQMQPDMIAITGDLVDRRDTDMSVALDFAAEAVQIAPCYYVTGNHEVQLSEILYQELIGGLEDLGVTVLDDEAVLLTEQDQSIAIAGHAWGNLDSVGTITTFDGYRILLAHAPENVSSYAAAGYDLVLSGHAHGGQFRLPFVGGLYAPGQGFLPKYDSGQYVVGDTHMIVSRGIGNSVIPLRFNNRPEVLLIVLECPE